MRVRSRLVIGSAVAAILVSGSNARASEVDEANEAAAANSAEATEGAPEAAQAGSEGGSEIVITAQRRSENLQDTPIAVSAFNGSMLESRAIDDVIKLSTSTPSLYMSQGTASPSTIQIGMRGALEQNGGTITSESPVAIYIDDVYQSRLSAANYDLADIERVEVLRGPQGTLYGRNSMTGAVKLITRQPDGGSWFDTDVSFGRFDEVRAKVNVGAPLSGGLALAGSAFYAERFDGWQYNETTGEDVSKYKRYGAQLALGVTNVDRLEAVLTGRYINSLSDGQHFLPIDITTFEPALDFYHTRTPAPADGDHESYSVSLRLGYEIGSATLRSITAYQGLNETWALDFAGGYVQPDDSIDVGFYRHSDGKQNQFTQEFQFLGKAFDDRLNYILGAFYFDENARQETNDNLAAFFLTYLPTNMRIDSKSLAFYGQVDYEIVPRLTASAGLRYTDDKKKFRGAIQNFLDPERVNIESSIDAQVWTPKFTLKYDFNGDAMVYATVSKGYRAASFNSLVIADPVLFGRPYQPEFAWSYEAGFKFAALNRRLSVNVAAYHQELTDLQQLVDAGGGAFAFENAAKAKVQGIETEATLRPVRGLNLFGNLTYTYDEYLELDPTSQAAISGADRLPLISRWQYQLGGSYDLDLGSTGSLNLAADYSYRSGYYSLTHLAPSSRQPSIGRANATVTYTNEDDSLDVYLQVSNLFDSKDWSGSAEFISGVFGYKIPLEPRVWRIGVRYRM